MVPKHTVLGSSGQQMFQCGSCNMKISDQDCLENHIAWVHDGKVPFECPVCKKCFLTSEKRIEHVRVVHQRLQKAQNWLLQYEEKDEIKQIEQMDEINLEFEEPTEVEISKFDLPNIIDESIGSLKIDNEGEIFLSETVILEENVSDQRNLIGNSNSQISKDDSVGNPNFDSEGEIYISETVIIEENEPDQSNITLSEGKQQIELELLEEVKTNIVGKQHKNEMNAPKGL